MISNSKCPKCEQSGFEVVTEKPIKSKFRVSFVRCYSCKTVVGVLEPTDVGNLIRNLAEKLNIFLD